MALICASVEITSRGRPNSPQREMMITTKATVKVRFISGKTWTGFGNTAIGAYTSRLSGLRGSLRSNTAHLRRRRKLGTAEASIVRYYKTPGMPRHVKGGSSQKATTRLSIPSNESLENCVTRSSKKSVTTFPMIQLMLGKPRS